MIYRVHRVLSIDQCVQREFRSVRRDSRNEGEAIGEFYLPMKSSLPGSSSYTSNSIESVSYCSTTNSNTWASETENVEAETKLSISFYFVPFGIGGVIDCLRSEIRFSLSYRRQIRGEVQHPSTNRSTLVFTFHAHEWITLAFPEQTDVRFDQISSLNDEHSNDTLNTSVGCQTESNAKTEFT